MEVTEVLKIESPFKELKKGVELQHGDLFYDGVVSGLKIIKQHFIKPRNNALKNNLIYDQIFGLEGAQIFDNGDMLPILYQISGSPEQSIYPQFLYPAAVFNITLAELDGIGNRPTWKQRPVLDANGQQITIMGRGLASTRLVAFHYVIINDRYVPEQLPDGTTNDNNRWTYGKPIPGHYILDKLNAERRYGLNPLDYPER